MSHVYLRYITGYHRHMISNSQAHISFSYILGIFHGYLGYILWISGVCILNILGTSQVYLMYILDISEIHLRSKISKSQLYSICIWVISIGYLVDIWDKVQEYLTYISGFLLISDKFQVYICDIDGIRNT